MTAPRLELSGVRETVAGLKAFGAEAADLRAAHQRVAELVTPLAAARSRHRTGALADSWTPAAVAGAARIRSGLAYAGPMEYGWPARGIPARLAVIRSAEAAGDAIVDTYSTELGRIIARLEG